jgi:plastocyanin
MTSSPASAVAPTGVSFLARMSRALVETVVSLYESDTYEDPFIHALRCALCVGDARYGRGFRTQESERGATGRVEEALLHKYLFLVQNTDMHKKLAIGGGVAVIVLGAIYFMIQPKEAVAPVDGTMETSGMEGQSLGPVNVSTATDTSVATVTGTPVNGNTSAAPKTPTTQTNITSPKPGTPASIPTTPAPAPFVTTVYYDGSNFLPETITIIQGGTVQFENTSDKPMWIASNNHPDHKRYPVKSPTDCLGSSFDQCKESGKGTTWGFTFTELGEWRYHNHARSFDGGEIIVVTKEKYLKLEDEKR